jgi:UDP-2,3-diacylglucosamine hydrolase
MRQPLTLTQFEKLPEGKSLYFASDFHLGAPNAASSLEREHRIVRWLSEVEQDAAGIFLLGDIFDFWFEYPNVIPKGFIHFQAKISDLRAKGIPVFFFTGNHDMWMFDYFPTHFGVPVYHDNIRLKVGQHRLLIGHGDGLGPGDHFYKVLKKIFQNRLAQWLFRWLHPTLGVGLAHRWSRSSRLTNVAKDGGFRGKEGEWLWQYCRQVEQEHHHDWYIFGHRHLPLELPVTDNSVYFNLGEWVNHNTYISYDGTVAHMHIFDR